MRKNLLRARHYAALVVAIIVISVFPVAQAHSLSRDRLPSDEFFSSDSFWYQEIPPVVDLSPDSAEYVHEFIRQIHAYYGTVSINTNAYASPVYYVKTGRDVLDAVAISNLFVAPIAVSDTVEVTQWNCQNRGHMDRDLARQWSAVPIPPGAKPELGTDAEMTIVDVSTGNIWEFWKARQVDGQWQACWGGMLEHAQHSDGIFPLFYGATAAGLPLEGGEITAEELARGEIRHVIGISLVDLEAYSKRSWPALRSDGYNPGHLPNRIREGQRFRLDPTVNVDEIPMTNAGRVIARAAQKYGFVVWDHAGAITMRAANPLTYELAGKPDPYPALFAGPNWAVLKNFPWDRLQFLPLDYGKP